MRPAPGPEPARGWRNPDRMLPLLLGAGGLLVLLWLKDARVPLDGSAYAAAVRDALGGGAGDLFRWSHLLHVPFLSACCRVFAPWHGGDIVGCYQALDVALGAAGLVLLHRVYRHLGLSARTSLAGCVLVLFCWAYWSEAAAADEKMAGFAALLAFLAVATGHLRTPDRKRHPGDTARGAGAGLLLAAAVLLHASGILAAPALLAQAARGRRWRYLLAASATTLVVLAGAYLAVLARFEANGVGGAARFFSSGVTSYSVFATGFDPATWARAVSQGVTKTLWAVFAEDRPVTIALAAVVSAVVWGGALVTAWRTRREGAWLWVWVLGACGLVFGLTYAPSAPDSYMVLLIPLGACFAKSLERPAWRWWAVAAVVPLMAGNVARYHVFADPAAGAAERTYQRAIGAALSAGDTLIVLDAVTSVETGTQTILPLHRYANPQLVPVGSSVFFADPAAAPFRAAARRGHLYLEGLCFETWASRADSLIVPSPRFAEVSAIYDLEPVVDCTSYSRAYHRRYKGVFRLAPAGAAPAGGDAGGFAPAPPGYNSSQSLP
jgi:hypothetical protein